MLIIRLFVLFLLINSVNLFAQNQSFMGALVRGDINDKSIALVFTGHEFADGGKSIIRTLKKQKVKGGFFLTGDFYRKYPGLAKSLAKHGHYMGAHSDQHLLYCSWENRDSLLVTKEQFLVDLNDNYAEMEKLGIKRTKLFLPPYEWYNQAIARWTEEAGNQLLNFTHGTLSHADYTTPSMKNYRSSDTILESIYKYEAEKGLNGFILLIHVGTDPERTDKLYSRLPELMQSLKERGYSFKRVDELLGIDI
jgi:endoglucanase